MSYLKQTAGGEIALEPASPKERFSCPITGAHFKHTDIVARLYPLERAQKE